jgi:hypothetical protein
MRHARLASPIAIPEPYAGRCETVRLRRGDLPALTAFPTYDAAAILRSPRLRARIPRFRGAESLALGLWSTLMLDTCPGESHRLIPA